MAMMDVWRPRRAISGRVSSGSSPFAELTRMQRDFDEVVTRLFGELSPTATPDGSFAPAVDVVDSGKEIVLRADLPGLEQKDVQVEVQDGSLLIRGERKNEQPSKEDNNYRWTERWEGLFMRLIPLPSDVDRDKIQAQMKNGILEVRIPRKQGAGPKKVEVKSG
jgi:HSP20 family protein